MLEVFPSLRHLPPSSEREQNSAAVNLTPAQGTCSRRGRCSGLTDLATMVCFLQ